MRAARWLFVVGCLTFDVRCWLIVNCVSLRVLGGCTLFVARCALLFVVRCLKWFGRVLRLVVFCVLCVGCCFLCVACWSLVFGCWLLVVGCCVLCLLFFLC